jgi:DNA-binding response OmpR family regulator
MRVLIVEDNREFASLVEARLAKSGIQSDRAETAEQAEQATSMLEYAAIILDLGLPGRDGLDFLRALRLHGKSTPVLIMTARHSLEDRVRGLRDGADDYLVKPFSLEELVARLHALLRRPGKLLGQPLIVGNVALNAESHQVTIGREVQFMRLRETAVLEILMRHSGNVVPRCIFEDHLFGIEGEQDSNTVDVYVHRLRKQLTDGGATVTIHTVRGIGYMLSTDRDSSGER